MMHRYLKVAVYLLQPAPDLVVSRPLLSEVSRSLVNLDGDASLRLVSSMLMMVMFMRFRDRSKGNECVSPLLLQLLTPDNVKALGKSLETYVMVMTTTSCIGRSHGVWHVVIRAIRYHCFHQ